MNPVRPITKLELNGSTYNLVADFESIAEAEEITGRPLILGLRQRDIFSPSVNLVRAMFFACAHSEQPGLTYDEIKSLVTRKTMSDIWIKVREAWVKAAAEEEGATEETDPTQGQK